MDSKIRQGTSRCLKECCNTSQPDTESEKRFRGSTDQQSTQLRKLSPVDNTIPQGKQPAMRMAKSKRIQTDKELLPLSRLGSTDHLNKRWQLQPPPHKTNQPGKELMHCLSNTSQQGKGWE